MGNRVFISYAWSNDVYQEMVINLATKLRNDGIDVILDKWDLHTGADRFSFMEKSVSESDKVLILCNKVYKEKADNRYGGAGQETMIIAPEVYEPMERTEEDLVRDTFGNAKGGLRTSYVEVPIATYVASNPDDPEGICGTMEYFTESTVKQLYGSEEGYLSKFKEYTLKQQEEGWLSKTDAEKMIDWSKEAVKHIRK